MSSMGISLGDVVVAPARAFNSCNHVPSRFQLGTESATMDSTASKFLCLSMWRKSDIFVWTLVLLTLLGCRKAVHVEEGLASYYADSFHGRKTASGEMYSKEAYTAAHRTLAFDTRVKVTNLDNDKSVWVRINDRGPHVEGRVIDLSGAAARKVGMTETGTARVRLEIYDEPSEVLSGLISLP